jgi:undecaprenyl pyrophosphate phosphatase UppP
MTVPIALLLAGSRADAAGGPDGGPGDDSSDDEGPTADRTVSLALLIAVIFVPISVYSVLTEDATLLVALAPIAVVLIAVHLLWRIARASERTADAVETLADEESS